MSRGAQNAVLLLLGGSVVVMLVKGTYLNYVKPSLMPWLVAAAVVLLALGLVATVRDLFRGAAASVPSDTHHHRPSVAWLLLVPIAMVAFVAPPALDANGTRAAEPAANNPVPRAFPPLPDGPSPVVSVPDVVMRSASDSTRSLDGRTITVSGFTLRYPDGIYLGRVVIVCCAADAQLARIRLAGPGALTAGAFDENTWVRLEGTVDPGSAKPADGFIPTMTATSATRIDKPPNTYAY